MAIIKTQGRPALAVTGGVFQDLPPEWGWTQPHHRENLERAIGCIGRVEVEGHPALTWLGVGVLIAPRRFITTKHVARVFCVAKDGTWSLDPKIKAYLVAEARLGTPVEFRLPVTAIRFLHPFFDVAMFEVGADSKGRSTTGLYSLALSSTSTGTEAKKIVAIGFAADDPRSDRSVIQSIYGKITNSLYLMPGELSGVKREVSRDNLVPLPKLCHDCSTLGGAAGAPLVDPETAQVVGIHYGGSALLENYAVPTWELARDPVVQRHVKFSPPEWQSMWSETEVLAQEKEENDQAETTWARHFSQDDIQKLHELLLEIGYQTNPERLLRSLDPQFIGSLRDVADNASDRILDWLVELNTIPHLADGTVPLRVVLKNAEYQSRSRMQHSQIEAFLKRLPEL